MWTTVWKKKWAQVKVDFRKLSFNIPLRSWPVDHNCHAHRRKAPCGISVHHISIITEINFLYSIYFRCDNSYSQISSTIYHNKSDKSPSFVASRRTARTDIKMLFAIDVIIVYIRKEKEPVWFFSSDLKTYRGVSIINFFFTNLYVFPIVYPNYWLAHMWMNRSLNLTRGRLKKEHTIPANIQPKLHKSKE